MSQFFHGCTILIGFLFLVLTSRASTFDYRAELRRSANYLTAEFRCWIPESSKPLAGALVILPGNNIDGREATDVNAYRSWCQEMNFALIGCFFTGDQQHYYSNARGGSGLALIDAVRSFSDQSDRRELYNGHLALIGFSTGAQFVFSFACDEPERVLGFVANKLVYPTARPIGGTYDTPGLFVVGEEDETPSETNTLKIFNEGRDRRALWAVSTAFGQAHADDSQKLAPLFLDYLKAVADLRLNESNPSLDLERLQSWDGIFIHRETGAFVPGEERLASGNPELNWLPGKEIAEKIIRANKLSPSQN